MSAPQETRGLAPTPLRCGVRGCALPAGHAPSPHRAPNGYTWPSVHPPRVCPGLPGHPPGACPHPPEQGDRYCAGCRAEWDAQPEDGGW